MNDLIFIDKRHGLEDECIPSNLVDVNSKYKENIKLDINTYQKWLELKEDVLKKGYNIDIESGYRSYDIQEQLLKELIEEKGVAYASTAVAIPGHSEHQTGLALDYCIVRSNQFILENEMGDCEECFYTNSVAHKYGFIVRYPNGKEDITGYQYEPWHLRYVGTNLSNYLYVNKITLDEYYKEEKNEKN